MSERREHTRAPIELEVEYKRLNAFFADYTHNIGRGGTFIRTSKPLPIDTEFVFRLKVPELAEPLVLKGRVRWRETEDEARRGMGIAFQFASEEEQQILVSRVEGLMEKSLGPVLVAKLRAHAAAQTGDPARPPEIGAERAQAANKA